MLELIKQPWSWWVAGIIIGLTVPTLLILGNKSFQNKTTLCKYYSHILYYNTDTTPIFLLHHSLHHYYIN